MDLESRILPGYNKNKFVYLCKNAFFHQTSSSKLSSLPEEHLKGVFTRKHKSRLQRPAMNKPSSLLVFFLLVKKKIKCCKVHSQFLKKMFHDFPNFIDIWSVGTGH
jgi:hypothetical protein